MTTDEQIMRLLAAQVPVTLLLDLVTPPDAAEVFNTEGGNADWLHSLHISAA